MSRRETIYCENCGHPIKTVTITEHTGSSSGTVSCPKCHQKVSYSITRDGVRSRNL